MRQTPSRSLRGKAVLVHTRWDAHGRMPCPTADQWILDTTPRKVNGMGTFPIRAFARLTTE